MHLCAFQIEREKRVILEEMRLKEKPSSGREEKMLEVIFPQVPGLRCSPLGDPESLQKLDRAQIQSFYDTWYRPQNAVLFATGNLSPAAWHHVEKAFGDWKPDPPPPSARPLLPAGSPEMGAFILHDDTIDDNRIDIFSFQPMHAVKTRWDVKNQMARELFLDILSTRLNAETRRPGAVFISAHAGLRDIEYAALQFYVTATCDCGHARQSPETAASTGKRTRLRFILRHACKQGLPHRFLDRHFLHHRIRSSKKNRPGGPKDHGHVCFKGAFQEGTGYGRTEDDRKSTQDTGKNTLLVPYSL